MRHLETQTRQLDRRAAVDLYCEYVSIIRVGPIISSDSPNVCGTIGMAMARSPDTTGLAFLLQGNLSARIAGILSLVTNVLATSLIGYKAWCVLTMLVITFVLNCLETKQGTQEVDEATFCQGCPFVSSSQGSRVTHRVGMHLLCTTGGHHSPSALSTRLAHDYTQIFAIVYQANPTTARAGPGRVYTTVAADFTYGCFVPLVVSRRPRCRMGFSNYDKHWLGYLSHDYCRPSGTQTVAL